MKVENNSDKISYCTSGFKNERMTLLFMRITVGKVQNNNTSKRRHSIYILQSSKHDTQNESNCPIGPWKRVIKRRKRRIPNDIQHRIRIIYTVWLNLLKMYNTVCASPRKTYVTVCRKAHNNAYALLLKTYNAAYQHCANQYDSVHTALYKLYNAVLPNRVKKFIIA